MSPIRLILFGFVLAALSACGDSAQPVAPMVSTTPGSQSLILASSGDWTAEDDGSGSYLADEWAPVNGHQQFYLFHPKGSSQLRVGLSGFEPPLPDGVPVTFDVTFDNNDQSTHFSGETVSNYIFADIPDGEEAAWLYNFLSDTTMTISYTGGISGPPWTVLLNGTQPTVAALATAEAAENTSDPNVFKEALSQPMEMNPAGGLDNELAPNSVPPTDQNILPASVVKLTAFIEQYSRDILTVAHPSAAADGEPAVTASGGDGTATITDVATWHPASGSAQYQTMLKFTVTYDPTSGNVTAVQVEDPLEQPKPLFAAFWAADEAENKLVSRLAKVLKGRITKTLVTEANNKLYSTQVLLGKVLLAVAQQGSPGS